MNYVSAAREKGQLHSVMCLDYANEPAKARAAEEGIPLADNMFWRQGELGEAAAKADIVTGHWWNHPLLYLWMALGKTPRARVLLWSHVSGFTATQVMTDFPLLARHIRGLHSGEL